MEGAGKLVEDEELREAMSEKGLGTPATRAHDHRRADLREIRPAQRSRIAADGQGVFADHAAARAGHSRALLAGTDGRLGIQAAPHGARQDEARRVHEGNRGHDARDRGQGQAARERHRARATSGRSNVPCPKCGGEIHENYKKFQCQKCDFALWKIVAGRQFEIPEVEELHCQARRSGRCKVSAASWASRSRPSSSCTPELKPEFDFGQRPERRNGEASGDGGFHGQGAAGQMSEVRRARV